MNFQKCCLAGLLGFFLAVTAPHATAAETTHNFNQWEKEIAAYQAHDRTNPPPTNAVLFIGSSTIRLWSTLATDFPGVPVINRGFGGCEIKDCTHFAGRILFPYAPRVIFFRAGGNDIAAGEPAAQVFDDFKVFVQTVHARLPDTEIFFISWSPTPLRWANRAKEAKLNELVRAYALHAPHLKYIEASAFVLGPDGKPRPELYRADRLHFDTAGYKLLAARVRPYVSK